MASVRSRLASCAWWHKRRLFCSSGRRMEPFASLAHAVMHGCISCTHNYVRLWGWKCGQAAAPCDGWRWRDKSPGCTADIKISSSRDAVERGWRWRWRWGSWPCHPPISPLLHSYLLVPFPSTSPIPLFICPLSTRLCATPVTILLTSTSSLLILWSGSTRLDFRWCHFCKGPQNRLTIKAP